MVAPRRSSFILKTDGRMQTILLTPVLTTALDQLGRGEWPGAKMADTKLHNSTGANVQPYCSRFIIPLMSAIAR
jgi:hypothetical protein